LILLISASQVARITSMGRPLASSSLSHLSLMWSESVDCGDFYTPTIYAAEVAAEYSRLQVPFPFTLLISDESHPFLDRQTASSVLFSPSMLLGRNWHGCSETGFIHDFFLDWERQPCPAPHRPQVCFLLVLQELSKLTFILSLLLNRPLLWTVCNWQTSWHLSL
jgi:hypothetical protein